MILESNVHRHPLPAAPCGDTRASGRNYTCCRVGVKERSRTLLVELGQPRKIVHADVEDAEDNPLRNAGDAAAHAAQRTEDKLRLKEERMVESRRRLKKRLTKKKVQERELRGKGAQGTFVTPPAPALSGPSSKTDSTLPSGRTQPHASSQVRVVTIDEEDARRLLWRHRALPISASLKDFVL